MASPPAEDGIDPDEWPAAHEAITSGHISLLYLSAEELIRARAFVFAKWCERAAERGEPVPVDLSRACKYGSLFMQSIYGGSIAGNYQHQYNIIDGHQIDLSDTAIDVLAMSHPYHHEAELFLIEEHLASMASCRPRVAAWVVAYSSWYAESVDVCPDQKQ